MSDLIYREALMEYARNHVGHTIDCNDIASFPAVDAEPVRHAENTTFIDTDDVSKWKSRVMVCERNSHWGRLYYESDTEHGKWIFGGDGCVVCSVCDEEVPNYIHRNYCPNCGAKMRCGDEIE